MPQGSTAASSAVDFALLAKNLESLAAALIRLCGIEDEGIGLDPVKACLEPTTLILEQLGNDRLKAKEGTRGFCSDVYHSVAPLAHILAMPEAVDQERPYLYQLASVAVADAVHARFIGEAEPGGLVAAERLSQRRSDMIFDGTVAQGYRELLGQFRSAHAIHGQRLFGVELMTESQLYSRRLQSPGELLPGHRHPYKVAEKEDDSVLEPLLAVPVRLGPGVDSHGRDISQLVYFGVAAAAEEFWWLARLAGAHVPKCVRDTVKSEGYNTEHVWLECMLAWMISQQSAPQKLTPETRLLLSSSPFRDSADLIEEWKLHTDHPIFLDDSRMSTAAIGSFAEVKCSRNNTRAKPANRPIEYDKEQDEKLLADWQAAKGRGASMKEFAADRGIVVRAIKAAQSRMRDRRLRDQQARSTRSK